MAVVGHSYISGGWYAVLLTHEANIPDIISWCRTALPDGGWTFVPQAVLRIRDEELFNWFMIRWGHV